MIKMGSQTYRALVILAGRGPMAAGDFGGDLWLGQKRGRTVSSNGGGDYAAQQFLGRLRKLGLVRTARETDAWRGSSRWEITPEGLDALEKTALKPRMDER